MELLTASAGSYPKIGEGQERQLHRQAYARWEKGEISDEEFERIQDQVTSEVIREQVRAGLDIVTDGQIRWYDPISHIARKLEGCEINGLLRFFDTNFYFRQPVITGKITGKKPVLRREFEYAARVSPKQVKPVITGPYTLARLSIDRRGVGLERIVDEFSEVISKEVAELADAGARLVQIDEPAIIENPEDICLLDSALGRISRAKKNAGIILHLYFSDVTYIYDELLELPVDGLSFDFTYGRGLEDEIADTGCEKDLGLGLIDGRNTRIEDANDVYTRAAKALSGFGGKRAYLSPSCGLEYLPREVAYRKLENMVAISKMLKEEIV
ncbi:MAG: hypothetical protein QXG10_04645 [Candidatus Hadarchaeales archaeon]